MNCNKQSLALSAEQFNVVCHLWLWFPCWTNQRPLHTQTHGICHISVNHLAWLCRLFIVCDSVILLVDSRIYLFWSNQWFKCLVFSSATTTFGQSNYCKTAERLLLVEKPAQFPFGTWHRYVSWLPFFCNDNTVMDNSFKPGVSNFDSLVESSSY